MIFSAADIFFLLGFAIGVAAFFLFGPDLFELGVCLFRKPPVAPSLTVKMGLDVSAFVAGCDRARAAFAAFEIEIRKSKIENHLDLSTSRLISGGHWYLIGRTTVPMPRVM